jgi:predicted nucleic acid-binding protein
LENLQREDDFGFPAGALEDLDVSEGQRVPLGATQEVEEFEIFGPAAAVDTQTAQDCYWIKEALARESLNFLEYVKNTLVEQETNEIENDAFMGEAETAKEREVGFETLFPPETNSMMVAAQAFHHVLTLATKNLLKVRQDEPFDDIWMGVKAVGM